MMRSKQQFITRLVIVPLLLISSQSFSSQLEKQGAPQIKEQLIQISSDEQIEKEIGIGKILNQINGERSGHIRLEWFDDDFSAMAKQVRHDLINKGIAPERITLSYAGGGYRTQPARGIQAYIQKIVLQLPECNYSAQTYKFRDHDEMGCAVNNNLGYSLVSPYKYYF